MADPVAVAIKRAKAEDRLRAAIADASAAFGVTYSTPKLSARKQPALAAVELIENVTEFLEKITATRKRGTK